MDDSYNREVYQLHKHQSKTSIMDKTLCHREKKSPRPRWIPLVNEDKRNWRLLTGNKWLKTGRIGSAMSAKHVNRKSCKPFHRNEPLSETIP